MSRLEHGKVGKNPAAFIEKGKAAKKKAALGQVSNRFDYMYGPWEEGDKLPETSQTIEALRELSESMKDDDDVKLEGVIPAGYTYFGQFVDHDLTFDATSSSIEKMENGNFSVLPDLSHLTNGRTAQAELDSVYFLGVPRNQDNKNKLRVGRVASVDNTQKASLRPTGKSDFNDLPRQKRHDDPHEDRAAIIGDARNDENTIVAQLHTAFLKAHNTLVDRGKNFDQARDEIILRYQSIILHDFAAKICDPIIHNDVIKNGPRWSVTDPSALFMPVEFAFAAYRFGHSMVRTNYDFNLNFNLSEIPASLELLFVFSAISGDLGDFDTLPENWIIEWEKILPLKDSSPQKAHRIDTLLTRFLFDIRKVDGTKEKGDLAPFLAKRNLFRGYLVGLPTGQAVAKRLGIQPLQGDKLLSCVPIKIQNALRSNPQLLETTPLWFYILAEAGDPNGPDGKHLGSVGSRIVMDTFFNMIKNAEVSLLNVKNPQDYRTTLPEILELAAEQDEIR